MSYVLLRFEADMPVREKDIRDTTEPFDMHSDYDPLLVYVSVTAFSSWYVAKYNAATQYTPKNLYPRLACGW